MSINSWHVAVVSDVVHSSLLVGNYGHEHFAHWGVRRSEWTLNGLCFYDEVVCLLFSLSFPPDLEVMKTGERTRMWARVLGKSKQLPQSASWMALERTSHLPELVIWESITFQFSNWSPCVWVSMLQQLTAYMGTHHAIVPLDETPCTMHVQ